METSARTTTERVAAALGAESAGRDGVHRRRAIPPTYREVYPVAGPLASQSLPVRRSSRLRRIKDKS
jgi:hypothetical protein